MQCNWKLLRKWSRCEATVQAGSSVVKRAGRLAFTDLKENPQGAILAD